MCGDPDRTRVLAGRHGQLGDVTDRTGVPGGRHGWIGDVTGLSRPGRESVSCTMELCDPDSNAAGNNVVVVAFFGYYWIQVLLY